MTSFLSFDFGLAGNSSHPPGPSLQPSSSLQEADQHQGMPADNIPGPEDYPDTVGDRPKYHVDKACHIGSGHFGAVYGGFFGKGALRKEVAIKFEKQTSHHNGFRESWYERDVLQMMDGKGCPHVYWSGRKGDRRIIVMDRGGPTLQAAMDARAPNRRLRADEVSALGMQAIIQLRNLHMMGFIHGDIKPDNFLLPFVINHPKT